MKKISLLALAWGLAWPCWAQDDAISKYFSRYSDNAQFTSVYISHRMLSMFAKVDATKPEDRAVIQAISRLKGLRILKSDKLPDGKKMYQEALRMLPAHGYEELMVIKSEGKDLKFLIVESGNTIKELLLLSGGGKEFFMLSMIGDIDLKQVSKLSKAMDVDGLDDLNKVKDKKR